MVEAELADEFDCKVCLEFAVDVYVCKKCDCIVCGQCKAKFKRDECPMCRAENGALISAE